MKKFKLFAVAALLLGSTCAFAAVNDKKAAGGFKLNEIVAAAGANPAEYEIYDFTEDYTVPTDGTVTIPSSIANSEGTFKVTKVADNAFSATYSSAFTGELRLKVKKVVIDAKIVSIGANAFADLGNLASVEFGTSSAVSDLSIIGDGAFAKNPMLKAISFANCPKLLYFTDDGEVKGGGNNYTTPFYDGVNPNDKLTTITLNEGTLDFGVALAHLSALTTQNIKDTRITLLAANALDGTVKIEALELPETKVYKTSDGTLDYTKAPELKDDALDGSAIKTLIVNGKVFAATGVGALGVPQTPASGATPAKNSLTSVTFKGDIEAGAIGANAFKGNTNLKTVTFEGELEAGAVVDGAFTNAGDDVTPATGSTIKLTVTALNAADGAFEQEAFAAADAGDIVLVKVGLEFDTTADVYNVKWEAAAAPASKIFLESNDNKTYYAKFFAAAKTSISKGKGDVVVYEAYADGSDIYMDPLYSINDKYVVEAGEAVIVKVKGTSSLIKEEDGKKYIECEGAAAGDLVTMRYLTGAGALANQLGWEDHETNQVINGYANAANNEAAYAVAKISTNGLKFQAISNEGTFYLNKCIYIIAKKSASGVRVIWLDEDATAIKNVKAAKAENGAIYNLAGQKVNASYKGVVIKDGKKYIQK